jgi:hypothetical protein
MTLALFKTKFQTRVGFGLAYYTKPYNQITNPDNLVFGNRLAAQFMWNISKSVIVFSNKTLTYGFSFLHSSNGHTNVPNVGSNIAAFNLGLAWISKKQLNKVPIKKESFDEDYSKKIRLNLMGTLGFHEVEGTTEPTDGPKYKVWGGSLYASKNYNYVNALGFGISINYYADYYNYIIAQEIFYENEIQKSIEAMLFAGHEFQFEKLAFYTQLGIKIYTPFKKALNEQSILNYNLISLYNTNLLGFNYYFVKPRKKHFIPFITIFLKTIGGKADYVGSGVGIRI